MEVHGIGSVGGSLPVGQTRTAGNVRPEVSTPVRPQDELTLSTEGTQALEGAAKTPSLREARLAQIKAAIDAGTYDTDDKMELALSRMFERIGITSGA